MLDWLKGSVGVMRIACDCVVVEVYRLSSEVCHAADRPSKVLCLSSDVRRADCAAEMRCLSGRPVEIAPSR